MQRGGAGRERATRRCARCRANRFDNAAPGLADARGAGGPDLGRRRRDLVGELSRLRGACRHRARVPRVR